MNGQKQPGTIVLELQREAREMEVEVEQGQSFIEVLKIAELPVDGVLVFAGGVPIPLDSEARSYERVTVVNVASGG